MSTADFVIDTFVIVLSVTACWSKWGRPLWNRWGGIIGHPFRMRSYYNTAGVVGPDAPNPVVEGLECEPDPAILHQLLQALDDRDPVGLDMVLHPDFEPSTTIEGDSAPEEELDDEDEEEDDDEEEVQQAEEGPSGEGDLNSGASATTSVVTRPTHLRRPDPVVVVPLGQVADTKWTQWMARVLRGAIHLIVMGQSDAGKTTVLQVFVESLVADGIPVVVCDPDAAAGDWPGTEIHGGGDDFDAINDTLAAIQAETRSRRQQRAEGQRTFDPLWVVLDEYADIKSECTLATTVVENLLRRARKLNIHLVIGVQDTQVKTMGFERKSELLNNARIVSLTVDAQKRRFASVDDEGKIPIPMLVPQQGGAIEAVIPAIEDQPIEFRTDPQNYDDPNEDSEFSGDKDDKIREMLAAGKSYGVIAAELHVATTRISRVKRDFMLED